MISPASWRLDEATLQAVREGELHIKALQDRLGLPDRITLGRDDQQLVFDLSDPDEQDFFRECLAGATQASVQEYLAPASTVSAGRKHLAAQSVAFISRKSRSYKATTPATDNDAAERRFQPGSDWLYLKYYGSAQVVQELLTEVIAPVVAQHAGDIPCWFFIRYEDEGGPHLRLRIRADALAQATIQRALNQLLGQTGLRRRVRDVQGGTYQRELERYGASQIDAIEYWFRAGSEAVLAFYRPEQTPEAQQILAFAIASAHGLILHFLPEHRTAVAFAAGQAKAFLQESGGDKKLRVALDQRYRALRGQIATWLSEPLSDKQQALFAQSAQLATVVKDRPDLLSSLVHMQLNRVFPVNQRRQELLVWHLLAKHLGSLQARQATAVAVSAGSCG